MRTALSLLVPFVLASLTGCSFGYSADEYCKTLANTQCQFAYRCCNATERGELGMNSFFFDAHTNEQECVDSLTRALCQQTAAYSDGEAAGRLEWDAAAAQECAANMVEGANSCDAEKYYEPVSDDCQEQHWIKGLVDEGDTCFIDDECGDDGVCAPEEQAPGADPEVRADGECKDKAAAGEACSGTDDCRSGLYCDWQDDTCKSQKGNGEDCFDDEECSSGNCGDESTCAAAGDEPETDYEICDGSESGGLFGLPF